MLRVVVSDVREFVESDAYVGNLYNAMVIGISLSGPKMVITNNL